MGGILTNEKLRRSSDSNNTYTSESDIYDDLWLQCIEKSCIFVWCDASIGAAGKISDTQHTIRKLADIINQNGQVVHTFNELNSCREFITCANNVCLIISGTMGEELVPLIHNLEQIHSIYIFCYDKSRHDTWAKHYQKIRDVCTDITTICESIKSYVVSRSLADYNQIEFDLINREITSSSPDKNDLCLIYSKYIQIILLNMNSTDHGKHDMINYCRNEYTSEYQIQLINDFERNYSQYNPIWWYTKNCFFQGIINRALRTHDLYVLCCMHRFLKDMDLKLQQLHDAQQTTESFDLYFGQVLPKSDFERLKNNSEGLMCINQFISASPEQGIAMMFIKQQNSSISNGSHIRILFQIHIDRTIESNIPYANIGSISQFVHEKEYLISMFSIYRINKIERLPEIPSIYFIQLTLVGRNDLQYQNLTESIQEEQLNNEINLAELGHLIKNRLHLFRSTNKLFKQVLFQQKQQLRIIILHYNMAIIYDALGEYEKSLNEYHNVINLARDIIPSCYQKDDLCLVPIYANMGLTYQQEKNKFTYALGNAFRALGIVSNIESNSNLKRELESSCCYCLGSIHDQEGKFSDAKIFYQKALTIRQEYLPLGHPDITHLQRLITLLSSE
jgi:hypothetical protein